MRTFTNLSGAGGNKISDLKTCQHRLFRMNTNKVVSERLACSNVWQKKHTHTHENLRELVECSLM